MALVCERNRVANDRERERDTHTNREWERVRMEWRARHSMCICLLNSNQILRLSVEQRQPPTTITTRANRRWRCIRRAGKRERESLFGRLILRAEQTEHIFYINSHSFARILSIFLLRRFSPLYIYVYARNIPKEPCHEASKWQR